MKREKLIKEIKKFFNDEVEEQNIDTITEDHEWACELLGECLEELKKPKSYSFVEYDQLRQYVGKKITLDDVWDWQTNRESGLEIRCEEADEPIFQIDNPDFKIKE